MGTRAVFTFTDTNGDFHVYKHWDCYPESVGHFFVMALDRVWPAGRFEADEFGAGFIAANKSGPGDLRLMPSCEPEDFPSDIEYHYQLMQASNGQLIVRAWAVEFGDRTEFFYGRLKDFIIEFSPECLDAYSIHYPSKTKVAA
jgi:hypothetical protein